MLQINTMKHLFVWISLCLVQFVIAQNGSETIKVTDMLKIQQVGNVNVSPDGSKTLFTVTSIEPDGDTKWEYRYINKLYLLQNDGSGSIRQLTSQPAGQPVWSPDSKQLLFVRAAEGRPQLFLLSMEGGEPIQLTKFRYGVGNPKWSPDGKKILFSANIRLEQLVNDEELNPGKKPPVWSLEKPGFPNNEHLLNSNAKADPDGSTEEIRAYLNLNATAQKAKVFNKLNFQQEATTSPELAFNHFFIMDASPNAVPKAITHGFNRFGSADFSPDGKQLILTGNAILTQHPDRELEGHIYLCNTDGSNLKKILGEDDKNYNNPVVSPSGKWLAFQFGNTSFVSIPTLAIMPLNGTAKDIVIIPFDRNKGGITWSKDEQSLYFTAQSNGGAPLYRADIKSRQVTALSSFDAGISSFDLRGNQIIYTKTQVSNPSELYRADLNMKNEERLTAFNHEWLQQKKLSFPEKASFVNEKGMTVEYWVMKPTNYEPGKKYPTILNIHGGPSAMWGPGENSMWHEFQYYAAKGYVVVYGNPRGSGGYGLDFLRGNINDWGAGPTLDVLTYLDKAGAGGFIDTGRLAVTGGSYAGYLVAWIIAHDQRFKAACAQRGVYELGTFFGEGNAWRLVPNYFGGYPWEEKVVPILKRESPINYVDQIKTPFIIFHGENDLRTGVIQSEMLYKSLKVLGRTVEYVRHPGGTHELTRSGNNRQRIDQMLRTIEFFDRFIKH
jgi:dipeptidyl aminopeptidase/acylaminoacyl peptidase